jgi:hypothetical protein
MPDSRTVLPAPKSCWISLGSVPSQTSSSLRKPLPVQLVAQCARSNPEGSTLAIRGRLLIYPGREVPLLSISTSEGSSATRQHVRGRSSPNECLASLHATLAEPSVSTTGLRTFPSPSEAKRERASLKTLEFWFQETPWWTISVLYIFKITRHLGY